MTVAVGVDVGTTGARGVAVDEAGEVVASATSAYELRTPRPLWTEQDPRDWWKGVEVVLGRLAAEVGSRTVGLGLTGQMHGSVFLDRAGEVIRPALLWNDQRTGKQCSEISDRVGAERLARWPPRWGCDRGSRWRREAATMPRLPSGPPSSTTAS